jgi:hypothetical protein
MAPFLKIRLFGLFSFPTGSLSIPRGRSAGSRRGFLLDQVIDQWRSQLQGVLNHLWIVHLSSTGIRQRHQPASGRSTRAEGIVSAINKSTSPSAFSQAVT